MSPKMLNVDDKNVGFSKTRYSIKCLYHSYEPIVLEKNNKAVLIKIYQERVFITFVDFLVYDDVKRFVLVRLKVPNK